MKAAKRILILLIPAMILFVAFFAVLNSGVAAHADKADYVYDFGKFIYRRSETQVALFYNGEVDTDVYFRIQIDDNEPYDLKDANHFDYEGSAVYLWAVRDEDEVYNEYVSSKRTLAINTYYDELIILPYGQTVVYNGQPYVDDSIIFRQDSTIVQPLNVGTYDATLNYETELTVPLRIVQAEVTVRMKPYSRRYGEKGVPEDIDIIGDVSDADKEYIESETFLISDIDKDTLPGTYPVEVIFNGEEINFTVTTVPGDCVILPGVLTGFTFNDSSLLYDGEPHSIKVNYDADKWKGLTITYDTSAVTEEGKYVYTVTVKKDNYEDLVLHAVLTIRTLTLESEDLDKYVTLSGDVDGYDPTIKLSLVTSRIEGIEDKAAAVLKSGVGYAEKILFTYDIKVTQSGSETTLDPDEYKVSIKLSGLTSMNNVRILRYNGTEFKEVAYKYENGYINFTADGLDGFVFVKKAPVENHSIINVIVAVGIGAVAIVLIGVIVTSFTKSGKAKRRSRRRHSRWV